MKRIGVLFLFASAGSSFTMSVDDALVFAATPLTSSPWLSPKNVLLAVPGARIADVRVDVGEGIRVAKISAITIDQRNGRAAIGDVRIEAEPGSLPAMSAWAKSH